MDLLNTAGGEYMKNLDCEGTDTAFPVTDTSIPGRPEFGLTKREYFAAKAMQGICGDGIPGHRHMPKETAKDAVAQADALIAELSTP